MALASLYRVTQDLQGNVVTDVLGTITLAGTSTLASLFSDAAGTLPLSNPLVNNPTYGSFQVYVGAGLYDMSFIKAGYTFETQRNIALRDPATGVNSIAGTANQVLVSPAGGIGAVTLSLPQSIAPDSAVQFGRLGVGTPAPAATSDALIGNHLAVGTTIDPTVSLTVGFGALMNGATRVERLGVGVAAPGGASDALIGNHLAVGTTINPSYSLTVGAGATVSGTTQLATTSITGSLDTAGTNRMVGDVAMGNSFSPGSQARIHMEFLHAARAALSLRPTDADTGAAATILFLNTGGTIAGYISQTATTVAYNTSSDGRLKEAIAPLVGALDVLRALRPVAFRWKADGTPGVGFVAQEVAAVVAGVTTGRPDAVQADGTLTPMGMDQSKLVPWLVAGLHALLTRVEALEAALPSR